MSAQPNVVEIHVNAPAIDRMGAELLKALVDEVRTAPAQWAKLSQGQQETLIARLRDVVASETAKAYQLMARGKRKAAAVTVESITVKEGAKAVLKLGDSVHDVVDYVGRAAVLVMCDVNQFLAGMNELQADKDQPELPIDAAAPQESETDAELVVGDEVRFLSEADEVPPRKVTAIVGSPIEGEPPMLEIEGMAGQFAVSLFARVGAPAAEDESDPIAEAEAEERTEAAAASEGENDPDGDDEADAEDGTAETEDAEPEKPSRRRRAKA